MSRDGSGQNAEVGDDSVHHSVGRDLGISESGPSSFAELIPAQFPQPDESCSSVSSLKLRLDLGATRGVGMVPGETERKSDKLLSFSEVCAVTMVCLSLCVHRQEL